MKFELNFNKTKPTIMGHLNNHVEVHSIVTPNECSIGVK